MANGSAKLVLSDTSAGSGSSRSCGDPVAGRRANCMTPIFIETAVGRLLGNPRVATQSRTPVVCPCYVCLKSGNTFRYIGPLQDANERFSQKVRQIINRKGSWHEFPRQRSPKRPHVLGRNRPS